MKKIILSSLIITGIFVTYITLVNNSESDSQKEFADTVENEAEVVSETGKNFPVEVELSVDKTMKNKESKRVEILKSSLKFTTDPKDVIESTNSSDLPLLVEDLIRTGKDFSECLKENFCNTQKVGEGTYFDKDYTPTHQYLLRSLEVIDEIHKSENISLEHMDDDYLKTLLSYNNVEIQGLALKFLENKNTDISLDEILSLSKEKSGMSKANLYLSLANSDKAQSDLSSFLNSIKNDIQNKDKYTAVAISEKVAAMKELADSTIKEIAEYFCIHKASDDRNWKQIRYNLNEVFKLRALNLDMDDYCISN